MEQFLLGHFPSGVQNKLYIRSIIKIMNNYEYYMGDEFYYRRISDFDIEIRHFGFDLEGNIDEQIRFVKEHDINGLSLSPKGEKINIQYKLACNIIKKLSDKLLLLVFLFDEFETLDILQFTPNLISLSLHCKLKTSFDFSRSPKLESLRLWYGTAFSSIFDCASIKELEIYKMDAKGAQNIQNLYKLKYLQIRQTSIKNIDALSKLSELTRLDLRYLPKLESISPLLDCKKIRELHFQNCKKVADWHVLGELPNLKTLTFANCGEIHGVGGLDLGKLEKFYQTGDTKLSG